jgi:hypothetical protein
VFGVMEELIEMGFDESSIRNALEEANGIKEIALDILCRQGTFGASSLSTEYEEETITVLEISQYTFADMGSSACTAISCAALAALLERLDKNVVINDPVFLSDAIISGVMEYSSVSQFSNVEHMSVEDLWGLSPDMKTKITKVGESFQGLLTDENVFEKLITKVKEVALSFSALEGKHLGILLTKPPETVTIIIPPVTTVLGNSSKYAFFDSHSRPEYGIDGSYLVTSSTVDTILNRLNTIFPVNNEFDLDGEVDSYMKMLYTTFEATIFQSK